MTTNDEWVQERAELLIRDHVYTHFDRYEPPSAPHEYATYQDIAAFGQEAIERTRAEERAHASEALRLAHEMQDKAVAEAVERERAICKMEAEVAAIPADEQDAMKARARPFAEFRADVDRFMAGRQSILARLENPDEAMIEAVMRNTNPVRYPGEIRTIIRALARTLTEGQEGESNDG